MAGSISGPWLLWVGAAVMFVGLLLLGALLLSLSARKWLRGGSKLAASELSQRPATDNPITFMSASMQAVIQRLREQEKELARLNQLERERAQQTARLSEAVTRNMPTGLLLINANRLITLANPAAEKALGRSGLAYRRYAEVFGPDSPLTRLLDQCFAESHTFQREAVDCKTPEGDLRHLGVTISPILSPSASSAASLEGQPQGKAAGALCLLSDLTQLTALQDRMRLQENLAALGEMSAGIAHEFKNALAIISGYAQMIVDEAPRGEMADCARRIVEQTRSLTRVVTEFLRFARPLEVDQERLQLDALVRHVVAELKEAMPQIEIAAEGEFTEIAGDEGLLRQALLNLGRNAAEAAAENTAGGRVAIRGTVEDWNGERVQHVAVLDNGPGIPSDDLSKLFIPFFTTKPGGTGLGLAVVQKIVLQHGGRIEARNQPGGGAEFALWLPVRREAAAQVVDSGSRGHLN